MTEIGSKSSLCKVISQITLFSGQKVSIEQYPTPPEIASEVLWNAFMSENISECECLDQGCGTGVFGIGLLLLGAKSVDFVDMDSDALDIADINIKKLQDQGYIGKDIKKGIDYNLICTKIEAESEHDLRNPIQKLKNQRGNDTGNGNGIRNEIGNDIGNDIGNGARNVKKYDLIIQNPPFGTKNKNIDKTFLAKAISQGKVIYSMHKSSTEEFLKGFIERKGGEIVEIFRFRFTIKKAFDFHTKPKKDIDVSCLKIHMPSHY